MNFKAWLSENPTDRATSLSVHFDLTQAAIFHWAREGVPVGRMAAVEQFTRRRVRIAEMVIESDVLRLERSARTEA